MSVFVRAKGAFTLIELLIVVAIIAILAAIAVPNFLEAQVRSKVSRVKADQRTIATALESYMVDHNHYPEEVSLSNDGYLSTISLSRLTTPVAYLSSLAAMVDVFNQQMLAGLREGFEMGQPFLYANYEQFGTNRVFGPPTFKAWGLSSLGPDRALGPGIGLIAPYAAYGEGIEYFMSGAGDNTFPDALDSVYDPTNGTTSGGDIMRFGGEVAAPVVSAMSAQ